jgi:hypothetical protein
MPLWMCCSQEMACPGIISSRSKEGIVEIRFRFDFLCFFSNLRLTAGSSFRRILLCRDDTIAETETHYFYHES